MSKTGAIEKIDGLMNNLAEAGVEIKLTRTEIADYIAAKAEELINQEIGEIRTRMSEIREKVFRSDVPLNHVPRSLGKVIRSTKSMVPGTEVKVYFREDYGGRFKYRILASNGIIDSIQIEVQVPDKELPKEVPEFKEIGNRYTILMHKLGEISSKKYRVTLVEKILRGTGKGQNLLKNLDTLAKSLAHS